MESTGGPKSWWRHGEPPDAGTASCYSEHKSYRDLICRSYGICLVPHHKCTEPATHRGRCVAHGRRTSQAACSLGVNHRAETKGDLRCSDFSSAWTSDPQPSKRSWLTQRQTRLS